MCVVLCVGTIRKPSQQHGKNRTHFLFYLTVKEDNNLKTELSLNARTPVFSGFAEEKGLQLLY